MALSYYRTTVDKTKVLNDKTLESYIDAIIAREENGENSGQEVLVAINYMLLDVEKRCILISNKVSQGVYSDNIKNANLVFVAKDQKLVAIIQDVSSMINAQSDTLTSSYAASALNKARDFGDSTLTTLLDGLVSKIENNEDYRGYLLVSYYYLIGLELNECQKLTDSISAS